MKQIILGIFLVVLSFACERIKETQAPQDAPQTPPPSGPITSGDQVGQKVEGPKSVSLANVILYPKDGSPVTLTAEVAKTAEEKRQGLQERENLGERHGMWFVFDEDVQEPFWMKNTPISLDIIFVDKDYKIVEIIPNAQPNSELLLVPKQKYRYTLELKAGSAAALKINAGDRVEFRLGPP